MLAVRQADGSRPQAETPPGTGVLAGIGAIFAALTGRQAWHSIRWTFIIAGSVLCVLNVAASGSGRAMAEPRTGTSFGGVVPDASRRAGFCLG